MPRKDSHIISRFKKSDSSTKSRYSCANHGYIGQRALRVHAHPSENNLMSIPPVGQSCRRLGGHLKDGGVRKDTRGSSEGRRRSIRAKGGFLPVLLVVSGACKGMGPETSFSVAYVVLLYDSPSQYVTPRTICVAVMRNRTGCIRHQE